MFPPISWAAAPFKIPPGLPDPGGFLAPDSLSSATITSSLYLEAARIGDEGEKSQCPNGELQNSHEKWRFIAGKIAYEHWIFHILMVI